MANPANLGPLTTVFTPPAHCVDNFGFTQFWAFTTRPYLVFGPAVSSCFPDNYNPARDKYYSPGSVCPSAYSPACVGTNVVGSVTDTIYWCCPTHYDFRCVLTADPMWPWLTTLGCFSDIPTEADGFWTISPIVKVSSGITKTTEWRGTFGAANAYSIQIRFSESGASTDATTETKTDGDDTSRTYSTFGSASQTSRPPNDTNDSKDDSGGGLSAGAAAGIGVVAAFAAMLVAIGAFLIFRRRRRQQQQEEAQNEPTDSQEHPGQPALHEVPLSPPSQPKVYELYTPPA